MKCAENLGKISAVLGCSHFANYLEVLLYLKGSPFYLFSMVPE